MWCFGNSSGHSSPRWYRGLKDTDPLYDPLPGPALNQARLTDAGQSAWNLRVTCPRRPPLRLNHRLPPSSSTCAPPPLPSCPPFLPVPGIYTGGWFWFSGICRWRLLLAPITRPTHPRAATTVPLSPLSFSLLVLQAETIPPPPLINGQPHFNPARKIIRFWIQMNFWPGLAGHDCTLFFFFFLPPFFVAMRFFRSMLFLFIYLFICSFLFSFLDCLRSGWKILKMQQGERIGFNLRGKIGMLMVTCNFGFSLLMWWEWCLGNGG